MPDGGRREKFIQSIGFIVFFFEIRNRAGMIFDQGTSGIVSLNITLSHVVE